MYINRAEIVRHTYVVEQKSWILTNIFIWQASSHDDKTLLAEISRNQVLLLDIGRRTSNNTYNTHNAVHSVNPT